MADEQVITIDKFPQGFVNDFGTNKVPEYFADKAINVRLVNNGIAVRNGFTERYNDTGIAVAQGITSNEPAGKILFVYDGNVYSIDPITWTAINLGSITSKLRARFINHGKYTIILTGDQRPFYWDGTALTQCTTGEIDDVVMPSFGASFAGFTMINRTDNTNVVSVSRPISLTTLGYCKDWKGTNAYTITLRGVVQGMVGTLSRFWIFTDKTIEYLSPNFLDATGSYVPTIFASGEILAGPDCVQSAGDIVFFVTKSKRIRSIGYSGTINEPQIKTLSDIDNAGIQRFLDEELKEDQSLAFLHHDKLNNFMKFHFVGKNSSLPDTILCWDINSSQWLLDMDKQFSGITNFSSKQYTYSGVGRTIYEDEVGEDDDGQAIEREYETQNMGITDPSLVKMWRGVTIAGQISNESKIRVQIYIDGNEYFDKYIDGSIENPSNLGGVGGSGVGEEGMGDSDALYTLVDFEKDIDIGRLRKTGKKIKLRFSGNVLGQKIIIDYLAMRFKIRKRKRVKDKIFTSIQ